MPTPAPTIFDSLTLESLRARTSVKWRAYGPDVLPLWVAEMDVPQSEPVIRAVHDAMASGDTGYDVGNRFAEAVADFAAATWGYSIDVAATRAMPDVMMGIVEVLRLVTSPGDAVVINPPVYPPFRAFTTSADRRVIAADLGADGHLDFAALDAAFTQATVGGARAAYLLCNPHNPHGTAHTAAELAAVGELAERHGVRVVVDEIHAPLTVTPGAFTPATTVIPRAISLMSGSKAFNLAGLKVAVAIPGPDAVDDLARLPEEVSHGVSHLAVIAQEAGYLHSRSWLDEVISGIAQQQRLLTTLLADVPGARWTAPDATYLAWIDLRDTAAVRAGADPAAAALAAGLAVNPGGDFGDGGRGFVRLNLATSTAVLTEGVRRLAAAVG